MDWFVGVCVSSRSGEGEAFVYGNYFLLVRSGSGEVYIILPSITCTEIAVSAVGVTVCVLCGRVPLPFDGG